MPSFEAAYGAAPLYYLQRNLYKHPLNSSATILEILRIHSITNMYIT